MSTLAVNNGVVVEVIFSEQPFGGVMVVKPDEIPLQIQTSTGAPGPIGPQGPPGPTGPAGSPGADGTGGGSTLTGPSDVTQLPIQDYVDVEFATEQASADWVLVECHIVNTVDPTPLNIWPGIITSKTTTGFQLQLSGIADSDNYFLHWAIAGETAESVRFTLSGDTRVTDTGDIRVIII